MVNLVSYFTQPIRRLRLILVCLASLALCSCGYSEDEWQAQLDKYQALSDQHTATQAELDRTKAKVAQLEGELKQAGFKLKEAANKEKNLATALEQYKARAATLERIKARFEKLRKKLEKLTQLGLEIQVRKNRMVISLPGDVLFASGKAELQDAGKDILRQVADVIAGDPGLAQRQYQVAGHTDDQPLRASKFKFKDNWGLSLMRARDVLIYLITPKDAEEGGGGLDERHWSASGYGPTDPIASNDTEEGRSKNRRVELVMLPDVEEMLDLKSLI